MRVAGIIACAIFVLSASVQFNDPDPARWVLAYLGAAGIALAALLGREVTWLATIATLGFGVGAAISSPALGWPPISEILAPAMKTIEVEEARESLGLALCAAWMAVLGLQGWRLRSAEMR